MPYLDIASFSELDNLRILPEHIFLSGERAFETEMELTGKSRVQQRALHGFVLINGNKPGCIVPFDLMDDFWSQVRFVGYAASLLGLPGLCAQTGHWVADMVKPILVSIDSIISVDLRSDPAFRHGQECLWLRTAKYEYALMDPFTFYQSLWSFTRTGYLAPAYKSVDLSGPLPAWWPVDKTAGWGELIAACKKEALPSIRKPISSSHLLGHTGRSPYHPERAGVAPSVHHAHTRPGRKDVAKRPAAAVDDTWEGSEAVHSPGLPGSLDTPKRSRVYTPEELEAMLDHQLVLSYQSNSGLNFPLDNALPNAACLMPWTFADD